MNSIAPPVEGIRMFPKGCLLHRLSEFVILALRCALSVDEFDVAGQSRVDGARFHQVGLF